MTIAVSLSVVRITSRSVLTYYCVRSLFLFVLMETKEHLRERIYNLLGQKPKNEVINHFKCENIPISTIYRVVKRWETGNSAKSLQKVGRPPILNEKQQRKVIRSAGNKVGVSQRKLAAKFEVSRGCIRNILRKNKLTYYKRQQAPKYTEKQLNEIPGKCRKLRRKFLDKKTAILMDDEKYFTFTNDNMPGNDGFYTNDKNDVPESVKFKCKLKFEKKVLVWATISEKGISELVIRDSSGPAVSAAVYQQECLPIVKKFIQKYHSDGNYIFWPDLASSHYARSTQNWMKENHIKFVPKEVNPPNVPKARPIEDFWSILSRLVYSDGWEATSCKQLKTRIRKRVKDVDLEVVQNMLKKVPTKLRKIEEEGPFAIL